MEANGFPLAPAILAVVLVPLLEDNLRRALAISDGNYLVFIERPISGTIVGVLALLLVVSGLRIVRRNRTRGSKQSVPA
jgi:putative tricarboxylic transport membrane protein